MKTNGNGYRDRAYIEAIDEALRKAANMGIDEPRMGGLLGFATTTVGEVERLCEELCREGSVDITVRLADIDELQRRLHDATRGDANKQKRLLGAYVAGTNATVRELLASGDDEAFAQAKAFLLNITG